MAKDLGKNQTTIKKVMRKLEDVRTVGKEKAGILYAEHSLHQNSTRSTGNLSVRKVRDYENFWGSSSRAADYDRYRTPVGRTDRIGMDRCGYEKTDGFRGLADNL